MAALEKHGQSAHLAAGSGADGGFGGGGGLGAEVASGGLSFSKIDRLDNRVSLAKGESDERQFDVAKSSAKSDHALSAAPADRST